MKTIMHTSASHTSIMQRLRKGMGARIIAATTTGFFSFVFYLSPTGAAIAEDLNQDDVYQQQLDAEKENTPAKKLAHRLEKLQHKVLKELPEARAKREAEAGAWEYMTDSDDDPVTSEEQAELADLKQSIDEAYTEAMSDFEAVADHIAIKHLPKVAKERQSQALQKIKQQYLQMQEQLQALVDADDDQTQDEALLALTQNLKQQRFKKPKAPFDPKHLPFGTPSQEVREPGTSTQDLVSALGIDPLAKYPKVAGEVTPQILADALGTANGPVQADLDPTLDAQITPDIEALAETLNHNPVEIYTWVHNNIRFIPSYGSIQGSQLTLETKRGNAIDTASLLIALLRASGIPARYSYGTVDIPVEQAMNWVGGVNNVSAALNLLGQGGVPSIGVSVNGVTKYVRMEHTWVEAYVDFEPSRGVKNTYGDHWIPMDASFKQYDFSAGMDVKGNVPFNSQPLVDAINENATVNESEGWVQNVPQQAIEDQLATFQQQLEDYIANQNPGATVGDVLGLKAINILPAAPLSAGLPYKCVTRQQAFSVVPDQLRHRFQYSLQGEYYGSPTSTLLSINEPTVALAGKMLALSFSPATEDDEAIIESYLPEPNPETGEIDPSQLPDTLPGYLIHLNAEFTKDGEVIHRAAVGTMGTTLYETLGVYSPSKGWATAINHPVAGEYRAIGLDLQGSGADQAKKLQQDLETTKAILESRDEVQLGALTKRNVVGDLLGATTFSYFALNNVQDEIAQKMSDAVSYRAPSYGIFSTSLQTHYWFGVPRNVAFSGLSMDVDLVTHQTVNKNNERDKWVNYNISIGSRYSAMENLVPEQMFSTEEAPAQGISAVKALAIANAQGQKIWTIDSSNLNAALVAINLDDSTKAEIRNAVLAGRVATAHEEQINFNGWIGEGYLLIDPETGAGAYKIAGGSNGGFLTLAAAALAALLGIVVTNTAILVSLPVLYLLIFAFSVTVIAAVVVGVDFHAYSASLDAIDQIALSLIFINLILVAGFLGAVTWPIFAIWLAVTFIPILIKNL